MKRTLFIIIFLMLLTCILKAQNCLDQSRKFFDSKDYISAEHALERCSKTEQKDTNVQISMGGIKLLLAKYDEAEGYFNTAL